MISVPAGIHDVGDDLVKQRELADAQWKCIKALERSYCGKRIRDSGNLFEEAEWRDLHTGDAIIWGSLDVCGERPALVLYIKIAAYQYLEIKRARLTTIKSSVSSLLTLLNALFISKRILLGCEGDYLFGINKLTSDDILFAIDARIALAKTVQHGAIALDLIKSMSRFAVNELDIFCCTFEYPWRDIGLHKWIASRYAVLNVPLPEVRPFLAMPPETSRPLIERSMSVIEKLSKVVLDIHRLVLERGFVSYGEFLATLEADRLFSKLDVDFDLVGGAVCTADAVVSTAWFESIVDLVRAACINIILLTSGIRNIDLTMLKKGCCRPSGRVDVLYYLHADVLKNRVSMVLPVPPQAFEAIKVLEELRWDNDSPYLIARKPMALYSGDSFLQGRVEKSTINRWLSKFAGWFNIPFITARGDDEEYTAHCYRATVAAWLDSASNLSVLLIRRLFGHANGLMPMAYLQHNPLFIKARKESIEAAAEIMSKRMAAAVSSGKVGGLRGDQLVRGYKLHSETLRANSQSLTDKEILTTFEQRIRERILGGSMLTMMTPFGVICARNPNDSRASPCAKRADKDRVQEFELDKELLDIVQAAPNPGQCIGKRCEFAILGPWSVAIKESLAWYVDFLKGRSGMAITSDELREEAKMFIRQYAADVKRIFDEDFSNYAK